MLEGLENVTVLMNVWPVPFLEYMSIDPVKGEPLLWILPPFPIRPLFKLPHEVDGASLAEFDANMTLL